jgi:TetR/AcrR family transcriptional repressor of nem operon
MALFRAKGFHRVTVEDLVEATGLNRFALYEKFGGKEELFYATIDFYHRVIIKDELLSPLYRDDASVDTVLTALRIMQGINLDPRLRSGCLIINANIELGGMDERVAEAVDGVMATFREAIGHALERSEVRGELSGTRSTADGVEHVVIMIQAFFSLAYISREAANQLMVRLLDEVGSWRGNERPVGGALAWSGPRGGGFQNARTGSP